MCLGKSPAAVMTPNLWARVAAMYMVVLAGPTTGYPPVHGRRRAIVQERRAHDSVITHAGHFHHLARHRHFREI